MATGKFKVGDIVVKTLDGSGADGHKGQATIVCIDPDYNYVVYDGCNCKNITFVEGRCCNGYTDAIIELAFTLEEHAARQINAQALLNWFNT